MGFDKKITNIVKSIAIILMLMHHLFASFTAFCEKYGIINSFIWNDLYKFSVDAKVCVGIYVFLTAFGITRTYNKNLEEFSGIAKLSKKQLFSFSIKRYVNLESNFIFVYIIAVLTSFLRKGGVGAVYNIHGIKKAVMYAGIDVFGLASFFETPTLNETWWYMSIAVFMIFLIPIFIGLYKDYGLLLVVISGFIKYIGITDTSFVRYIFCVVLGIWCAEEEIFERLYSFIITKKKRVNSMLKMTIYMATIIFLFFMRRKVGYSYWIDAFIAVLVSSFSMELYHFFSIASVSLVFLGKHSMNIFLIHTLICKYYFTDFIYGFRNWIVVLCALLGSSLLASIIIEKLKDIIKYKKLMDTIYGFIQNKEIT